MITNTLGLMPVKVHLFQININNNLIIVIQ